MTFCISFFFSFFKVINDDVINTVLSVFFICRVLFKVTLNMFFCHIPKDKSNLGETEIFHSERDFLNLRQTLREARSEFNSIFL